MAAVNRYRLYGQVLESQIPFPELSSVATQSRPGGRLRFQLGDFPSPPPGEFHPLNGLRYWFSPDHQTALVSSPLGGRFRVHIPDRRIEWKPPDGKSSSDLARVLLRGKVLGILLSHVPSSMLLHANVVVRRDRGIGLCGPIGQGKSTLTGFLLSKGFSLLSDDTAVIHRRAGSFHVQPGTPEIRLWPSALRVLGGGTGKGAPLHQETKKRRFILQTDSPWRFARRPARLRTLYSLRRIKGQNLRVETLKGKEALLEVLRNIYIPLIPNPKISAGHFEMAEKLVRNVPVKRLLYPSGRRHLPRIRKVLLEDLG